MMLTEHVPGKSRRIQLTGGIDPRSTVWRYFLHRADVYICPRILGGAVSRTYHEEAENSARVRLIPLRKATKNETKQYQRK